MIKAWTWCKDDMKSVNLSDNVCYVIVASQTDNNNDNPADKQM